MTASHRVTVRNLLSSPSLRAATIEGGEGGLSRAVGDVELRERLTQDNAPRVDSVVILDASTMGDHLYQIDVAVRLIGGSGGAALVVANAPPDIGISSRRLANRLDVPLVVVGEIDAMTLTERLRAELWQPEVEHVVLLDRLVEAFAGSRVSTPAEAIGYLSDLINTPCGLLGHDQTPILGSKVDISGRRLADSFAPLVDLSQESALISVPISLTPGEPASYWLVADSERSDFGRRSILTLMSVGSWYLASLLSAVRVRTERDARRRVAVLNEILDSREVSESEVHPQMAELGWTTTGWNAGLQVKVRGLNSLVRITDLHADMRDCLRRAGLSGPLVERNDGWSGWITTPSEPEVGEYSKTLLSATEAMESFSGSHGSIRVHAGIGRPYSGLSGLRRSLLEAHEAAVIAQAKSKEPFGAAHIDQIGAQRVLMGWFGSEDFAGYARSVLKPLIDADSDGSMLATLEAYLDSNCSSTDTSHRLAVHRNTVSNRIRRASDLLGVRLEDPESRLSIQLACRMIRMNP